VSIESAMHEARIAEIAEERDEALTALRNVVECLCADEAPACGWREAAKRLLAQYEQPVEATP
jgi:hypothetical protein